MTKKINFFGYSLVELTIVVGLVSILSITISAIVLATITNSTRIRNKIRIRQTGDYAVGQIQTMIRNARELVACDSSDNSVTLLNPDHKTTRIYLEGAQIASNSGVLLTPTDISITNYDLTCLPSDSAPTLLKVSFTAQGANPTGRASENPTQSFNFSTELRNE